MKYISYYMKGKATETFDINFKRKMQIKVWTDLILQWKYYFSPFYAK